MNQILTGFVHYWQEIKRGNASALLVKHSDLLVAVAMVAAIASIIIPVPTSLISLFIVFNLANALIVLMVSLYIAGPVQLSSYPTILLITTLFRLCLSICVTRSILTTGHAGDVINALGNVTASGNIIVGGVMFIIILVVQFVVVAKGSERVAEVAARFTLDAMPGKQMSIDADMRAGLLSPDQARSMRSALQRESQLYGAMDGAMKFVKNDAVATIIIAMVNIIAGLATGVLMKGLTFAQAAHKYTILTIGDGLAAIIPSVLISVSAGMVITRVSSDEEGTNIGSDISRQVLTNPKPLSLAAGLLLALMLIPGMPKIPLLILGGSLALIGYSLHHRQQREEHAAKEAQQEKIIAGAAAEQLQPTFAVPISVVVSPQLSHLVNPQTEAGARFRAELPKLRSAIYYDLGVLLPNIHVSQDAPLPPNNYFIAIKEVPALRGTLNLDKLFVNDSAANIRIFGLDAEEARNPANREPGAWIPRSQRDIAERAGLKVWQPSEVLLLQLSNIMKRYAHEFIGIQEAQAYLEFTARGLPHLVEAVVPSLISIHQFTDVLQRLVQEGVSIRDIKSILDALAEWARIEKDSVMLTEQIRASLKRYLSFRFSKNQETLFVYLLDPEIEDVIRGAIRRTSTGSFLSLDPSISHDILGAFRRMLLTVTHKGQKPVVITDVELRRFVRKMIELEFPALPVLSYQELAPELRVQPVGRISMRPPALPQKPEQQAALPAQRAVAAAAAKV